MMLSKMSNPHQPERREKAGRGLSLAFADVAKATKPILWNTLIGVHKPMLVAIVGVAGKRTFVEFCLCVLEYETDV